MVKINWDDLDRTTEKVCDKIRRMFNEAQRVHVVGGHSTGRRHATQADVDRARLAGQTVWVQRFIDGRQLTETQPGVLLEAPYAMLPKLIHVPRSVVASWPAESRLLGAADEPDAKPDPAMHRVYGDPSATFTTYREGEEHDRYGAAEAKKDWEQYQKPFYGHGDPSARFTIHRTFDRGGLSPEMDAVIDRMTGRNRKGRAT